MEVIVCTSVKPQMPTFPLSTRAREAFLVVSPSLHVWAFGSEGDSIGKGITRRELLQCRWLNRRGLFYRRKLFESVHDLAIPLRVSGRWSG